MDAKKYVQLVIGFTGLILALMAFLLFFLYQLDLPYTNNDAIRLYQMKKLYAPGTIETIIVGDSAAGHAINARLWSELSGSPTANLALTGSFGLAGSYNMIRQADKFKRVKNVIIIHTLDIWRRDWSEQGYIDTLKNLPRDRFARQFSGWDAASRWRIYFNPQEIAWFIAYRKEGGEEPLRIANDFLPAADQRFSNGKRTITGDEKLEPHITDAQIAAFHAIDQLCGAQGLTCVYMHGPLHQEYYRNSREAIENINAIISRAVYLNPLTDVLSPAHHIMGDAPDHIDPAYKDKVTTKYFEAAKQYLKD